MRLFLFALIFVFGMDNWHEFTSKEGNFRVLTPLKLELKQDTLPTAVGDLVYHTFFAQSQEETGNQVYMVSYCDYPDGSMHSDSIDLVAEFLETTLQSAKSSVRGELLYATDELLEDYPGKRWRIDYLEGKAVIKTRAFVVDNRYYSIQVVAAKERHINPESDKFLNSFRLLE